MDYTIVGGIFTHLTLWLNSSKGRWKVVYLGSEGNRKRRLRNILKQAMERTWTLLTTSPGSLRESEDPRSSPVLCPPFFSGSHFPRRSLERARCRWVHLVGIHGWPALRPLHIRKDGRLLGEQLLVLRPRRASNVLPCLFDPPPTGQDHFLEGPSRGRSHRWAWSAQVRFHVGTFN